MSWKISTRGIPQSITGVAPTLDYRFAIDRNEIDAISLTDKLTYTGGNGTFVGSDGFIQRATTNVPRFDHDPLSRQSLGLLSEGERTNSIRNNTMVGAVAGTPGTLPTNWGQSAIGLTREIVGFGIENGINYVDVRYSGTTTSQFGSITLDGNAVIAAAPSQSWTISSYIKLVSGSTSGLFGIGLAIFYWGAGQVFLTNTSNSIALSGTLQRYTLTGTSAAGTDFVQPRVAFSGATSSGNAVDFTLRIGLPQLELGATASTPIPTSTTAVTRTADSAVIDGTGVITGTYTLVEKPAGCAVVSGSNIELQPGFRAERITVFPAALTNDQITAVRAAM